MKPKRYIVLHDGRAMQSDNEHGRAPVRLAFGDCATAFPYSTARRRIEQTLAYAEKHGYDYGRWYEYKIVRLTTEGE